MGTKRSSDEASPVSDSALAPQQGDVRVKQRAFREISAEEVLEWRNANSPAIRVKTDRDALPGGLALAMAPVVVRWQDSPGGFGPDDYYVLANVNVSSNPVSGTTVLGGLKVYADSVESVEFVMVISKVVGRETAGGHGMLRFIFREDRRPVLLDQEGRPVSRNPVVDDIVLSWEAWRPPVASWNPVASLDPETYALTPRCLVGSVRCLSDSVLDRPWHCYPIQLPDVEHSYNELLYVSLTLADAVARQTIIDILDEHIGKGADGSDSNPDPELEEWKKLNELYKQAKIPENPIKDILDGKIRYHLLERSCITMALQSVDWANHRIHSRAGLVEPRSVRVAPGSLPSFMAKLASGKRSAILLRAPAALHWLMTNQTVIPSKAHELLDEVGLLKRVDGKIQESHFDNRRNTPYGLVSDHLIY